MTFETFKSKITSQLAAELGSDVTIKERRVAKNNNLILDGLVITRQNDFLSPTIYLNDYYDACSKRNVPFDDLFADILAQYKSSIPSQDESLRTLSDYEKIRHRIVFRLVNYEKNAPLLSGCPHIRYLDLAVTFLCLCSIHSTNDATIGIKNEHLNLWGISADELYEEAKKNTPKRLPFILQNIAELLPLLPSGEEPFTPQAKDLSFPMFVLSNESRVHGAGCLLYDGVAEHCAEITGGAYYILPSSIHELLLIPASATPDPDCLNAMIAEVNRDMLAADEYLSDHAYYYDENSGIVIPRQ